jgi:DNA-binding MurR/RpiR family transcriptional regulator
MYRERIRNRYEQFSPGFRRIADYLLGHYQDAAFMTAAEIAATVQVDTALVVRFAQRLGYPGFPELIGEVQNSVKRDLQALYVPPAGDDSPGEVYRRNLLQDRNNLDHVLQHLDLQNVLIVLEKFAAAQRVFLIGEGNLTFLAQAFAGRMVALGFPAHVIMGEFVGLAAVMAGLRAGDLFIGLSSTNMSPNVPTALKVARESGATTIAIAAGESLPAAAVAEYSLQAPVTAEGLLPSWTAMAAILHALGQTLAFLRDDHSAEWAARSDHLLRAYLETFRGRLGSVRETVKGYNL